ncbi:MAG TPA: hypothetical protein VIW26_04645 [Gemmatimonadales bacterium]|jgi:hypothetical protein
MSNARIHIIRYFSQTVPKTIQIVGWQIREAAGATPNIIEEGVDSDDEASAVSRARRRASQLGYGADLPVTREDATWVGGDRLQAPVSPGARHALSEITPASLSASSGGSTRR